MLVLFVDAFVAQRRSLWRPFLVGVALAAAIAPFLYYFELWRRKAVPLGTWGFRFSINLFNINEYVVPTLDRACGHSLASVALANAGCD